MNMGTCNVGGKDNSQSKATTNQPMGQNANQQTAEKISGKGTMNAQTATANKGGKCGSKSGGCGTGGGC